jgi:hypothetical protein
MKTVTKKDVIQSEIKRVLKEEMGKGSKAWPVY